jgi:hypothetical protein
MLFPFVDRGIVLSVSIRVHPWFQCMKSEKKKVAFPGRTWQINPVTRGKHDLQKHEDE